MGDCGNYNASVHVEYSLRKKEKNTEEDCKKIIESGIMIEDDVKATEKNIKDLYEKNIDFILSYKDWEEWRSKDMTVDEMLEALDSYYDDSGSNFVITTFTKPEIRDIDYLDFDMTKGMKTVSKDLKAKTEPLLSVYESIYCDNDNSSFDVKSVTKLEKYLKLPDARLVLIADGDGNC